MSDDCFPKPCFRPDLTGKRHSIFLDVPNNPFLNFTTTLPPATTTTTTSPPSYPLELLNSIVIPIPGQPCPITRPDDTTTIPPIFFNLTGGIITDYDIYRSHTFLTDGEFKLELVSGDIFDTPDGVFEVEYFIVAGGGGGGQPSGGGGGGAGGVLNGKTRLSVGTYQVIVGRGGQPNQNGQNSVFKNFTAIGGGKGGSFRSNTAGNGGSGGGAGAESNSSGGFNSGIQGNRGGNVSGTTATAGAGGGGAKQAGAFTSSWLSYNNPNTVGNGGNGIQNDFRDGTMKYYAGGGGGGSDYINSNGGLGGGGSPCGNKNGETNTGSGGAGAGCGPNNSNNAGSGGSGIVVIRYIKPIATTTTTTSTTTSTTSTSTTLPPATTTTTTSTTSTTTTTTTISPNCQFNLNQKLGFIFSQTPFSPEYIADTKQSVNLLGCNNDIYSCFITTMSQVNNEVFDTYIYNIDNIQRLQIDVDISCRIRSIEGFIIMSIINRLDNTLIHRKIFEVTSFQNISSFRFNGNYEFSGSMYYYIFDAGSSF